jgi:hypothetical protein
MTLAEAVAADRDGLMVAAASLYERDLASPSRDIDSFINLAILYWQSAEYGFWTTQKLPRGFVEFAGKRWREVLDDASALFPTRPEVLFWKKYIAWADLGEPFNVDECRSMLQLNPNYLEPAMFLFLTSQGLECKTEALELLRQSREVGTCRNRYVASVIDGMLKRGPRPS